LLLLDEGLLDSVDLDSVSVGGGAVVSDLTLVPFVLWDALWCACPVRSGGGLEASVLEATVTGDVSVRVRRYVTFERRRDSCLSARVSADETG
jgi:hypothetical protein